MEIVIDGFGGDNSPDAIISGCAIALQKHDDLAIAISGNEEILKSKFLQTKCDMSRIKILNSNEIITNDDSPVESIRTKKDSSLVVAYDYLKANESCVGIISAGSTGAILAGGLLKIGRLKGISRPALAPLIPTISGKYCLIIDGGSNVDCKIENLCQFAMMGNLYYKLMFGVEPRVALLNVGTEKHKGNDFLKEAYAEFEKLPINFVGNMEARDATSGKYDVIVCDGLCGNILLKSLEGGCSFALKQFKNSIKSSFLSKIGVLFMKKSLKQMMQKIDYNKYGGSPFLGTKKLVIKSHGSSDAGTIASAIEQLMSLSKNNVIEKISDNIAELELKGTEN